MPGIIVLTATPDKKTAKKLADRLVRKKIASCVSILDGLFSIYRWKGKIEHAHEALLFIKSSKRHYKAIEDYLRKEHPYELPEIVKLTMDEANREYLSWLQENLLK